MTTPQRDSVETEGNIAAADDGRNYDNVAITLHWLTAALVVTLFGLAVTWDYFPHETADTLQGIHVSLGVILALVIVVRIVWHLMPQHHVHAIVGGWQKPASKAGEVILYILLVTQVVLGFGIRWLGGHPVEFFGLPIPSPFEAVDRASRRTIHGLHEKIGWAIVIIAFGHAMMALYHHYVVKDRVLQRMLPTAR